MQVPGQLMPDGELTTVPCAVPPMAHADLIVAGHGSEGSGDALACAQHDGAGRAGARARAAPAGESGTSRRSFGEGDLSAVVEGCGAGGWAIDTGGRAGDGTVTRG